MDGKALLVKRGASPNAPPNRAMLPVAYGGEILVRPANIALTASLVSHALTSTALIPSCGAAA